MEPLFLKTFLVVGLMLLITAFTSKHNKAFETQWEFWLLFIGSLAFIFLIPTFSFPLNLAATLVFAGVIGLMIGPGIRSMMMSFVVRKELKSKGYTKERLKEMTADEQKKLISEIENDVQTPSREALVAEWNNIVGLAIYSTAGITVTTALIVFFFNFNFSFLGQILSVSLLGLIIVGLLNIFFFRSPLIRLVSAYVGAVVFSAYLLYDFDRLKQAAGDVSWETAIHLAISIYLDIINLFLDLLQILSDSN